MSDWLDDLPCWIGQIFVTRSANGEVVLCHRDDVQRDDLTTWDAAEAARELVRFDDAGQYRPLKTAPNLRHGWRLVLKDCDEARLALHYFYPGRAAAFRAWTEQRLTTTPLRETLGRQTGMYRVAASIGDREANEVIANLCRSDGGCLRTIFWRRDLAGSIASPLLPPSKFDPQFDQTERGEDARPLLCQEACNLLVAELRKAVKTTAAAMTE